MILQYVTMAMAICPMMSVYMILITVTTEISTATGVRQYGQHTQWYQCVQPGWGW